MTPAHIRSFSRRTPAKVGSILTLEFQPFSEPAFLAPHHGLITGLPIEWSILSLVYTTWWISVGMSFLLLCKCLLERFHIEKFRETQQEAIVNLLGRKVVLVSQPTASEKVVISVLPDRMYLRFDVALTSLIYLLFFGYLSV